MSSRLPPGWAWVSVDDLVAAAGDLTDGPFGSNLKTEHYRESGPRVIRLQNIGDGQFLDDQAHISTSHFARLRKHEAIPGDVVVAMLGSDLPRACLVPPSLGPAIVKADCVRLRPDDRVIDRRYAVAALNSPAVRRQAERLVHGVGRPRLGLKWFRPLRVPLAPVAEQARLVDAVDSHLSRLDAAVAGLESAQRKLKAYRASVLKAAVEGRLIPTEAKVAMNEGRDYEAADVLLERILKERRRRWEEAERAKMRAVGKTPKDDSWKEKYEQPISPDAGDFARLPQGWSWTTVDQLGEVSGGLTKNAARDSGPRRYPYLRVANVYANRLALDEVKEIAVDEGELPRLLLRRGDLLVVEGNGSVDQIGRVALWDGSIDPVVHQNHLIKVRFGRSPLERWVLTWLLSPSGRGAIERVASSTSGLHTLSISKVQSLPVPLPPENEQVRVLETVDQLLSIVDASADGLDAGLRRCRRLRQTVLRAAFEGKLVDQDPADEPADVLLARIHAERASTTPAAGKPKRSRKLKAAS